MIVGAGGFGREVLHWARDAWPDDIAKIVGFLAPDQPSRCTTDESLPPIVATPDAYVLLAIGIPGVRRRVAEILAGRGATFLTLIHPTAIIASTATISAGSIICPYAIVSDSASLGRCTLLNYHSSLGHDASAGDFTVLSPYATLGGAAAIAGDAFLGLHASVGPGVRLGPRSKVSANSSALHDVPADSLVHGVPGRTTPLITSPA